MSSLLPCSLCLKGSPAHDDHLCIKSETAMSEHHNEKDGVSGKTRRQKSLPESTPGKYGNGAGNSTPANVNGKQAKNVLFDATGIAPDRAAIRAHLEFIAGPARQSHPDALIEIAYDDGADGRLNDVIHALLFGLGEIDKAVDFAILVNAERRNVYVGVTLKKANTPRKQRTKGHHALVATCMAGDIDADASAVQGRIDKLGVDIGARVVTGFVPERREHVWTHLPEPCVDLDAFDRAFKSFVAHIGGDAKATGRSRVLRLGGTLSYPPGIKREKGYVVELTTLKLDETAKTAPLDTFLGLDPLDPADKPSEPRESDAAGAVGPPAPTGKFMADVNTLAIRNLAGWVPKLFGQDAMPRSYEEDGYRVSSEALGRDLQEDISLHTQGIVDFGVHDLGDPRQGKRSPIDVVMEWSERYGRKLADGKSPDTPELAARWLCEQLGIDVEAFKRSIRRQAASQYLELGREVVEQDGSLIDKETGEILDAADTVKASAAIAASVKIDTPSGKRVLMKRAADIKIRGYDWVWKFYLCRGKLHIIAGAKGDAKSTIGFQLAAIISTGGRFPDGARAKPSNVIIWSGEDGEDDTIVPRLVAMGADRKRIFILSEVDENGKKRPFDPSIDLENIEAAMAQAQITGDVALLILDPVVSAVKPGADSHKNAETRQGLQPVVDFAKKHHCAVLGVHHLTKGTKGNAPVERLTGSLAFGAIPRIVLMTAKRVEPEDGESPRVLVRAASNIGPDGGGFGYDVEVTFVNDEDGVTFPATRIKWGEHIAGAAKALIDAAETAETPEERRSPAMAAAKTFLADMLKNGPQLMTEVVEAAEANGHSKATLRRAREKMAVKVRKTASGAWEWALCGDMSAHLESSDNDG